MAKNSVSAEEKVVKNKEPEEFKLDKLVAIKNLSDSTLSFRRQQDGQGDVKIAPGGQYLISRNELKAQVDSNNNLISGIDGMGAHASIFIDDEPTRRWLGFEFDGKPQEIFSYDLVRKLFDMPQKEFEQELPKKIRTRAEKSALMKAIDELELNDYRKIIFSSKYAENHF